MESIQKWHIKGRGVGPWGGAFLYKTLVSTPPPPPWVSKPFVRYAYRYPIHCKNTLGIVHLTTLETRRLGPRITFAKASGIVAVTVLSNSPKSLCEN